MITGSSFKRLRVPALVCALSLAVGCGDASNAVPTAPGLVTDGGAAVSNPAAARSVIRVPGDFSTIQAAVDAADSGDTIEVASGVYCEQVLIVGKSDLRLHSAAGSNRAVITGDCSTVNRLGSGIHVMNATGIEIQGFVVEYFEYGIQLMKTTDSQVHLNEVRFNTTSAGVTPGSRGVGIVLSDANTNIVSRNQPHDNGRNGILVWGSSSGNVVQANRLRDNNLENSLTQGACNLMLGGGASGNSILENEILGKFGSGIMIGSGGGKNNIVAQNRVHGFGGPGILAMPPSVANIIEQNDARGNGLKWAEPENVDLFDRTNATYPVADNIWNRNLGTCGPGAC